MIFVLPLLLYPLLGMSLLQVVAVSLAPQPTNVLAVNLPRLADRRRWRKASALTGGCFRDDPQDAELLKLSLLALPQDSPTGGSADDAASGGGGDGAGGKFDAALDFPARIRRSAGFGIPTERCGGRRREPCRSFPVRRSFTPTATSDRRSPARGCTPCCDDGPKKLGKSNLAAGGVPAAAMRPFEVETNDVAAKTAVPRRGPLVEDPARAAVDLGHDRGVLSGRRPLCRRKGTRHAGNAPMQPGPAERNRAGQAADRHGLQHGYAVLNLLSMGVTGCLLFGRGDVRSAAAVGRLAGDRPGAGVGPVQRLVPGPGRLRPQHQGRAILPDALAAGHDAAGHAADDAGNGTEPGQQPDSDHRHGAACCAALLEGPTGRPCNISGRSWPCTLTGCLLAVRWAVEQFNSESVLFRESERLDMGLWLRHLLRDRQPTPSVAAAVFCGVLDPVDPLLSWRLFRRPEIDDFSDFTRIAVVTAIGGHRSRPRC